MHFPIKALFLIHACTLHYCVCTHLYLKTKLPMFSIQQTNMILHQSLIKQTRTSDHVEYTRKSQLTEDESKCHKNNKGLCGQN